MIRYKDKVFEQYSICPATGDIFDAKTGEVQKIRLHNNRPTFKRMHVHCIMIHTFYGYKPEYVIHHLDENKMNNALSNLVYLTPQEHIRTHFGGKPHPHKGHPHSKESRAKMSAAHKGKPSPMKNRHLSEESRAKMSAAHKGKPSPNKGKHYSSSSGVRSMISSSSSFSSSGVISTGVSS